MLHSMNCRCFLRAAVITTNPRCWFFSVFIKPESCIMSDRQQQQHYKPRQFSQSFYSQRSQSYDYRLQKQRHDTYSQAKEPRRSVSADIYLSAQACENRLRQQYCSMRRWENPKDGEDLKNQQTKLPGNSVELTVLSYNVLAQELLAQHTYLYRRASQEALNWDKRAERLIREFKDSQADVLCLQEIQADHYDSFYLPRLERLGFRGIYKKRTGDKSDGCAIFYRNSKFLLREAISVEYCKPGVKLLDRDNIGLIALLSPRQLKRSDLSAAAAPFICIATTHLLYNPKRHDIKLAQLQLLFAELDRIAFNYNGEGQAAAHSYHPVILTGDFNLTPDTKIYQFITSGSIEYEGLSKDLSHPLKTVGLLEKELIPPHLNVTDQCQHLQVAEKRSAPHSRASDAVEAKETKHPFTFSSGQLSHKLQLRSAYPHRLSRLNGASEATTRQKDWVTVDYIFYRYGLHFYCYHSPLVYLTAFHIFNFTSCSNSDNTTLTLLSRLGLLAGCEVDSLGGLPNLAAPSDHLPLVSTFSWKYC